MRYKIALRHTSRERNFKRRLHIAECKEFLEHGRWLAGVEQRRMDDIKHECELKMYEKDEEVREIKKRSEKVD